MAAAAMNFSSTGTWRPERRFSTWRQKQTYLLSMIRKRLGVVLFALFTVLVWGDRPASAGTLSGNFAPVTPGTVVNLTAIGNLDWADWGFDPTNQFNHKSGAGLISDFSLIGSSVAVQYATNFHG